MKKFIVSVLFLFSLSINYAVSKDFDYKLRRLRNFNGPLASVFTPFKNDSDQSLNLSVIPSYANFLLLKFVKGVLVADTLGEGTSLTVEERKQLAEAWVAVTKPTGLYLMINVGGVALKSAKELAAHAESIGADSILVLPDLYVKPYSYEDTIDYLRLISEAAPNTPLLHSQNDELNLNIDIARFLTNVDKKVPTFAGIKHVTKTDLLRAWLARREHHKIFVGDDELSLIGCVTGMNSMITSTSTLIPKLSIDIVKHCHDKESEKFKLALDAQISINKIVKRIDSYGHDTVAMKAATSMVAKIPLGSARPPYRSLSTAVLQSMARALTELGFQIQ